MPLTRQKLHCAAQTFCNAFATKKDITTILSLFSTTQEISATEHGEPALAPFLGRRFEGVEGIKQYFKMIGSLLTYESVSFSEYVVDPETRKVALKGRGKFKWVETGESWDEIFSYVLDFDEDLKVVQYQVWADTGAAYLARTGELDDVRKGF
ncbi:hypothetical protein CC2G_010283 [Coprinopsis cinerea AmutBmut pab1-1]|nr:hypothetical protein CC2G_010283 [Coprinopsis cinerea AmutBmut pab1-1]